MLKKEYETPLALLVIISKSDILSGSDVLIDGSGLFDDEQ